MLIEPSHPSLSIKRQCELLGLCRASYYYQAKAKDALTEKLMQLIDERYTQHPTEGARKLSRWLCAKGYDIGRYKVCGLMKQVGLAPIYPKPNLSAPAREPHAIYPYQLADMDIIKPDQVWCADITYIRTQVGHVYLVAIMDWFSRYVLAWELGTSLEADFCVSALKQALRISRCETFNTDQGSQFTSKPWIDVLTSYHITISMDGRGRYLDNIFVERLWRSVKYECIYLQEFWSVKEVRKALNNYFHYYNFDRLHEALDYKTPYQVYSRSD
jgi:putative transposase